VPARARHSLGRLFWKGFQHYWQCTIFQTNKRVLLLPPPHPLSFSDLLLGHLICATFDIRAILCQRLKELVFCLHVSLKSRIWLVICLPNLWSWSDSTQEPWSLIVILSFIQFIKYIQWKNVSTIWRELQKYQSTLISTEGAHKISIPRPRQRQRLEKAHHALYFRKALWWYQIWYWEGVLWRSQKVSSISASAESAHQQNQPNQQNQQNHQNQQISRISKIGRTSKIIKISRISKFIKKSESHRCYIHLWCRF